MLNYHVLSIDNGGNLSEIANNVSAFFKFDGGRVVNSIYTFAAVTAAETEGVAALRVYPVNIVLLAFRCAKNAAATAANRGGKAAETEHNAERLAREKAAKKAHKASNAARLTNVQDIIYSDLRRISAALAEYLSNVNSYVVEQSEQAAAFIYEKIAAADSATQDYFSVAVVTALEQTELLITDSAEQAADVATYIYAALNKYTYGERTNNAKNVSTEFITDNGGNLVSFGTAAASILHKGDKWTPTAAAEMTAEQAAALGRALAAAFDTLTPTERKVTECLVNGLSQRQTAAKIGVKSVGTIGKHVAKIRAAYTDYIENNAAEFMTIIDGVNVRRTAADIKKAENANAAERMRRYRERKAAERKAAEQAKHEYMTVDI